VEILTRDSFLTRAAAGLLTVSLALPALPATAAEPVPPRPAAALVPIELGPGITQVPDFTPDGRAARILRSWRENGNAHGYFVYVVTTSREAGQGDWMLVPISIPTPWQMRDTLTDAPHTFEDMARSVRFARGQLDGEAEMFLFTATREIKGSYADPTPVDFELYRVVVTDEMGDVLERVRNWRAAKRYCNADAALWHEVGLALPTDYAGGAGEDGCP
jgi:hypothetical protein